MALTRAPLIGETTGVGSRLVSTLRSKGHEVLATSPDSGVNTITGEGLPEALAGAQVVVDVANSPSFEDAAVLKFFETSGTNLLAAEARAGVRHGRILRMSHPIPPVFRLVDLRKTYGEGEAAVHALRGVGLEIAEGELVVLLGPSGSGKSTLLNVLGGLDRPTGGKCFFRELDLAAAPDAQVTQYRRLHVGFVFQFYNLIASLTAAENVELVTEVASDPMPAQEALELVGLGKRLHHFPAQLSGGEQQRVAIARAIAKRPTVLLCDEPTGALDVATGIHVLEAIVTANEKLHTTTLLITHNADIARLGDRVVRFADGLIRSVDSNDRRIPPGELQW